MRFPIHFWLFALICPIHLTSCIGPKNASPSSEPEKSSTYVQEESPTSHSVEYFGNPMDQADPLRISDYIRRIFQDSYGNLWFGTNGDGVCRYDGDTLMYFNMESGFGGWAVRGIVEDKQGNIWFATSNSLSKYDPEVEKKTGKASFTNFTKEDGLPSNDLWSIMIDSKGIIWIGTYRGACRFDGKEFSSFSLPEAETDPNRGVSSPWIVHDILEDSKGKIWFGTNGGAQIYDPGSQNGKDSLSSLSEADGLSNNTVNGILEDKQGNFWFATHHRGVCSWNGNSFTHYGENVGITDTEAWDIYADRSGNIWFPIEHAGVYRYDGESFTRFHENEGLASGAIQCFLEDREGRMWFGGAFGLFRFDGTNFFPVNQNGPWQ